MTVKVLPCSGAIHCRIAIHQGHEFLRDGEPEAGSTVLAAGRDIRLGEGFEQAAHRLRIHADSGIGNGDFQALFLIDIQRLRPIST